MALSLYKQFNIFVVILESSPDYTPEPSTRKSVRNIPTPQTHKSTSHRPLKEPVITKPNGNVNIGETREKLNRVHGASASSSESTSPLTENIRDVDSQTTLSKQLANGSSSQTKVRSVSALDVQYPELSAAAKVIQVSAPPHLRVILEYFCVLEEHTFSFF